MTADPGSDLPDIVRTSLLGLPIIPSRCVEPGRPVLIGGALHVAAPSHWATQVWDDLHARLPWIKGGDDDLTRVLYGIHPRRTA